MKLDAFTRAYIEYLLWAEIDEDTRHPLEEDYDPADLAPEALEQIKADCERFQGENETDITEENFRAVKRCSAEEQAGHDFWLTRNGHGAGFWDGDWEEAAGERLSKAAKAFGECHIYPGDDRKLYLTQG